LDIRVVEEEWSDELYNLMLWNNIDRVKQENEMVKEYKAKGGTGKGYETTKVSDIDPQFLPKPKPYPNLASSKVKKNAD